MKSSYRRVADCAAVRCNSAPRPANRFARLCPGITTRFRAIISTIPNSRRNGGITPAIFALPEGRRFGFELTFFRQGVDRGCRAAQRSGMCATCGWRTWLATELDRDGGHFLHTERLNRSGAGIAGADETQARVWNGNWQAQWKLDPQAQVECSQQLQAVADHFSFDLAMKTTKPPVIHGENGISQKAEGPGRRIPLHLFHATLPPPAFIVLDGQRFKWKARAGWITSSSRTSSLRIRADGTGSACSFTTARRSCCSSCAAKTEPAIRFRRELTSIRKAAQHIYRQRIFRCTPKDMDQPQLRRPLSDRMEHSRAVAGAGRRHHHSLAATGTHRQDPLRAHVLGRRNRSVGDQERTADRRSRISRNDRLCGACANVRVGHRRVTQARRFRPAILTRGPINGVYAAQWPRAQSENQKVGRTWTTSNHRDPDAHDT